MDKNNWVAVIAEDKLQSQDRVLVSVATTSILIFRINDNELYAISNKCAHMGCPLQKGKLNGYIITCPCHDWRFDIRTGEFLDAKEITITVYPVKIKEGMVYISCSNEQGG